VENKEQRDDVATLKMACLVSQPNLPVRASICNFQLREPRRIQGVMQLPQSPRYGGQNHATRTHKSVNIDCCIAVFLRALQCILASVDGGANTALSRDRVVPWLGAPLNLPKATCYLKQRSLPLICGHICSVQIM
jgi:hypothetical protein